ncbi:unnamed protein product [Pedinophyceae sp. YPF-701]|nr:unnamed protein product [Pedinophyceae sp. YPF-701]
MPPTGRRPNAGLVPKSTGDDFLDLDDFLSLRDIERAGKTRLSVAAEGYYSSGADDGDAAADNLACFRRIRLVPRMLRDVGNVDVSTTLFGTRLDCPVVVAPMAMQRMATPEGELATARASAAAGVPMCLSTMATADLREVSASVQGMEDSALWFQLYVLRDRDFCAHMIREAQTLGYRALVVTVDAPVLGNREADHRNRFTLPEGLRLKNLERLQRYAGAGIADTSEGSGLSALFKQQLDPSLTWETLLPWLRSVTTLPILVKGILHPDDARLALRHGVDGIIVSNHGGRQLGCAVAAADVLPAIARVVQRRVPVLVDGGVRRGTDVLKCLAMGADAVMLGRPVLWGLACGGEAGAAKVLAILRHELRTAMALCGCATLGDITPDLLLHAGARL